MSLAAKLSSEFTSATKAKGTKYFQRGVVQIENYTATHIAAVVTGNDDYQVMLRLDPDSLAVACTCPYFDSGNECKHIWATILAADEKQYLSEANAIPKLTLDLDHETFGDFAEIDDALDIDEDIIEDDLTNPYINYPRRAFPAPKPVSTSRTESEPSWKTQLSALTNAVRSSLADQADSWPSGREIFYIIDVETTRLVNKLTVDIAFRERRMNGEWGKIKSQKISLRQIATIPDSLDRQILTILAGAKEANVYSGYYDYGFDSLSNYAKLSRNLQELILPLMCDTGRCRLRRFTGDHELPAVSWDAGNPWQFWLTVDRDSNKEEYVISGVLRRDGEEVNIKPYVLIDGLFIDNECRASRLASDGSAAWLKIIGQRGAVRIPATEADELTRQLFSLPSLPKVQLPEDLQFETIRLVPRPGIVIRPARQKYYKSMLQAELVFDYGGMKIEFLDQREGIYDPATRRLTIRDREAEMRAYEKLKSLRFKLVHNYIDNRRNLELAPGNLPRAVKTLLNDGWQVQAEGKLYRRPGAFNMAVSSGIDWFELNASVDFGDGLQVRLPTLLNALQRGETMVQLGDGSFGLLPEEWLKKYGVLVSLGETVEDQLRFTRTQTGVLDALLAAQPEITFDAGFAHARQEWGKFTGVQPIDPPKSFRGKLREYQREGLGWFQFLQQFRFGGCLADDMGLGKTVQVLALLESRRAARNSCERKPEDAAAEGSRSKLPSLVVVPRSLVFNWQQEAARFNPKLCMLTHVGGERVKGTSHFEDYDVVLTTYGTLRRDAADFTEAEFDFIVLDEAQAIKNARTESAKAARLLKAQHRLALSGTPIENHLGELWSLFEFLNPGMLGAASVFQLAGASARTPNVETRTLLANALRPFILRRTKQQVARELPEKLEQTIYCEMEASQRKQYEELRDYYRSSLLQKVETVGLSRSKLQILEALLRLRQAACHPALVSKQDTDQPSAKLEVLFPQLQEVIEEGHKSLVFSQFTSFLSIVRQRLDHEAINYEYLDGKTRDRAARVERFQNDPACKLFLISLKAGGLGLNLTAAEYVFLLDPWWNPAVEAQAIDRAHRIGQSRRVFAYRLITRETVEEKVLALQDTKRELAEAIISADNNLIRSITKEDLQLLLS